MATPEILAEELNIVASYAGVALTFKAEAGPEPGTSLVTLDPGRGEFLVDTAWAFGNVRRLPDHADVYQILSALRVSHPKVKGVGTKR